MRKIIKSDRLGENYTKVVHDSGLTILMYPMQGFTTTYALFGTNYGSIDTCFKTNADKDFVTIPEGTAHFLEHKLFESEEGDAFSRYATIGASANAFTSFDRTAYLFSCADHWEKALEILLDFVTHPYFTEQTVQKEQGIIGQEIKMYDDSPDWRVLFNLLGALYHNNPVKVDIAGTVESIAQINADMLYRCYRTFYNLNNMVLAIAGNFEPETVLQLADKILKKSPDNGLQAKIAEEPYAVRTHKVEQHMPIATPIFQIGLKAAPSTPDENMKTQVIDELLLDIIAGESSAFYSNLYKQGFINATFSTEAFAGRDYVANLFAGESRDPYRVYDSILNEINRLKTNGIDPERFETCKRALYGRYFGMFARVESVASIMMSCHFAHMDPYELLEIAATVTLEQAQQRLQTAFDTKNSAISVVLPMKG